MSSMVSRLSLAAAALAFAVGSATACEQTDLAGNWMVTFGGSQQNLCNVAVGADGTIGANGCWHEIVTDTATWAIAGTLTIDPATCMISATLTPTTPAAAMKNAHRGGRGGGHGGGHGGGNGGDAVTLTARLLSGFDAAQGILTSANGKFSPVSFTRLP